ncbi:MAG: hypothetical protein ACRBCK_10130 [Alphaproteobacteria bacterium]
MPVFPIDLPTKIGFSSFSVGIDNAVAVAMSEFTFEEQVQRHLGQAWEMTGTIELLDRDEAEIYNAFILKLGGREGTFTMGVAGSNQPRGNVSGSPVVDGEGQLGENLSVKGFTPSSNNVLRVGDYIQLGVGSSARLYKVLDDVNSDESGNATLELAPRIVRAPTDEDTVITSNAKGVFRLKTNLSLVDIKPPYIHKLSFSARGVV